MERMHHLLEHPVKIGFLAFAIAFASLLAEGTLINLWDLKREKSKLQKNFNETIAYNRELSSKIAQAKSSDGFIGRQARDKLDLAKDDELVFVFESENSFSTPR